jgi:hypothetical protein
VVASVEELFLVLEELSLLVVVEPEEARCASAAAAATLPVRMAAARAMLRVPRRIISSRRVRRCGPDMGTAPRRFRSSGVGLR